MLFLVLVCGIAHMYSVRKTHALTSHSHTLLVNWKTKLRHLSRLSSVPCSLILWYIIFVNLITKPGCMHWISDTLCVDISLYVSHITFNFIYISVTKLYDKAPYISAFDNYFFFSKFPTSCNQKMQPRSLNHSITIYTSVKHSLKLLLAHAQAY